MYDDMVLVLSSNTPTAKKQHKCMECRRMIEPGEKYLLENYVWEGKFSSHKTCTHCQVVREFILQEDDVFYYGMIDDALWNLDSYGTNRSAMLARLMTSGMHRQWKRRDGKMWRPLKI